MSLCCSRPYLNQASIHNASVGRRISIAEDLQIKIEISLRVQLIPTKSGCSVMQKAKEKHLHTAKRLLLVENIIDFKQREA